MFTKFRQAKVAAVWNRSHPTPDPEPKNQDITEA